MEYTQQQHTVDEYVAKAVKEKRTIPESLRTTEQDAAIVSELSDYLQNAGSAHLLDLIADIPNEGGSIKVTTPFLSDILGEECMLAVYPSDELADQKLFSYNTPLNNGDIVLYTEDKNTIVRIYSGGTKWNLPFRKKGIKSDETLIIDIKIGQLIKTIKFNERYNKPIQSFLRTDHATINNDSNKPERVIYNINEGSATVRYEQHPIESDTPEEHIQENDPLYTLFQEAASDHGAVDTKLTNFCTVFLEPYLGQKFDFFHNFRFPEDVMQPDGILEFVVQKLIDKNERLENIQDHLDSIGYWLRKSGLGYNADSYHLTSNTKKVMIGKNYAKYFENYTGLDLANMDTGARVTIFAEDRNNVYAIFTTDETNGLNNFHPEFVGKPRVFNFPKSWLIGSEMTSEE